ncbi:MAG: hypothetical protein J6H18_03560 [Lachnospiraceae bacterium]|nr:hypothetical protein [Lachnospiraceae bacterium]
MDRKKRSLGQFYTKDNLWLKPQIIDFINNSHCEIAYDPFAGEGDLLEAVAANTCAKNTQGLDIDEDLPWDVNDSLLEIPPVNRAIIVTNPPYISNYSAARKHLLDGLQKYFNRTEYDDIYLLALDNMLHAQKNVVAIVPETFINSRYRQKDMLQSITILEENPFVDTETPVVVLCFDSVPKPFSAIRIYKNSEYICTLQEIEDSRLKPAKDVPMAFNDLNGWLGVRCVDTTDPGNMIRFDLKENIPYDWQSGIKISSRLLTLVSLDVEDSKKSEMIVLCNTILAELRTKSFDMVLSPFKGNMKNGIRRRRLDYETCRAIIETAYKMTIKTGGAL